MADIPLILLPVVLAVSRARRMVRELGDFAAFVAALIAPRRW